MKTPIILNASKLPEEMGDVECYSSINALLLDIVPYDLENNEYFAFDADGHLIDLIVVTSKEGVQHVIARMEDKPNHRDELFILLKSYLIWIAKDGRFGVSLEAIKKSKNIVELVRIIPQDLISQ